MREGRGVTITGFGVRYTWAPAGPCISSVTLDQLLNLVVPHLPAHDIELTTQDSCDV